MKNFVLLMFGVFLFCGAQAQSSPEFRLIVFSGSDWCKGCIQLKTETLDNEVFQDFLAEHGIQLQIADFPRKKSNKPSKELAERNDELARQYNQQGVFPKLVLLDVHDQRVYAVKGFISSDDLVKGLAAALKP